MVGTFTFEIKPNRKQLIIEKILDVDAQPGTRINALYTLYRNRILRERAPDRAPDRALDRALDRAPVLAPDVVLTPAAEAHVRARAFANTHRALVAVPSINLIRDNNQFAIYLKKYSIDTLISYANLLYEQNGLKPLCWEYETKREKIEKEKRRKIRIAKLTEIIEPEHFATNLWSLYCWHNENKERHQRDHILTPQNEIEITNKINYKEIEIVKYIQNFEKKLPNYELYQKCMLMPKDIVGEILGYLPNPSEMIQKAILEPFEIICTYIQDESHQKRFTNWFLDIYIPKYTTLPIAIEERRHLIIKL